MRRFWIRLPFLPLSLFLLVAYLVLVPFVVKWLWAWTVPGLFPGAVREGLVARSISWFTAFKLALFLAILSAIVGIRRKG
ncbi:MAG: hypothetical protein DRP94_08880 [Candidatus Latescibacterota bacterium]|nr:MAG: hypothetical protein DRP94_08880 [Candidatus Latescibacterota bacterium]RKY74913.1 MAG: hypothetical protein DRQ14_00335 [Candidatus Latescibacterota bacterium]HDI00053.1 hypothetical protein [Bacillota bacterium]